MEVLQARLDTFRKNKRTKNSSKSLKWPHPSTYLATPESLADAGFYYHPSSEFKDCVTCFMCEKELSDWDAEDNPYITHWSKCRNNCAWAAVRCSLQADLDTLGSFDFSDTMRLPSSKTMEKARLDTFTGSKSWPHDSVKGHTASSKKMAKAGFAYTPQSSGDDTVTCFYCGLSLSGWDDGDDPNEEHLKREEKSGPCPFFQGVSSKTLLKSTSKPPSRAKVVEEPLQTNDSEDELATTPAPTAGLSKSKSPKSARSAETKTPASRRSTRGGSRTTGGSEVEDTEGGSGSDAGKRVSKTKRKGQGKKKGRITAIEEEDELEHHNEDEEAAVVEKPKPKRGRPPKGAKAIPEVVEAESAVDDIDADLPPPVKKVHTRTRSHANVESETDAPLPPPSKPTHLRMKSTSRATPAAHEVDDSDVLQAAGTGKGRRKAKRGDDSEPPSDVPMPTAPKPARTKTWRAKSQKAIDLQSDDDNLGESKPVSEQEPEAPIFIGKVIPSESQPRQAVQQDKASNRQHRFSPVSDDAGYATAELPAEPQPVEDIVDVDDHIGPVDAGDRAHAQTSGSRSSQPSSSGPAPSLRERRGGSILLSRNSSMTDSLNGRTAKGKLKVVEITSDGEEEIHGLDLPHRPSEKVRPAATMKEDQVTPFLVPKEAKKKMQAEFIVPRHDSPPLEDKMMVDEGSIHAPADEDQHVKVLPTDATNGQDDMVVDPSTPPRSIQVLPTIPQSPPVPPSPHEPHEPPIEQGQDSLESFTPFMAMFPIHKLTSLTDEESSMTVEQYVRRQIELQCQQFKADGERRISQFKEKAAETRQIIEAL